jgi:thymidylate synthase
MQIRANTLSEAHEGAIDAVLECHKKQEIQTHADKVEKTIEFEDDDGSDDIIVLKIAHPLAEPQVSQGAMFKEGFIEAYKKQFLTLTPPRADGKHATYTYWNRLADYSRAVLRTTGKIIHKGENPMGIKWLGNGDGQGKNQIAELIKKLAEDARSRRAVMVTWNPAMDSSSLEPPCMNWIQIVIRNRKVNMRVIFRSQDILSGLGENLIGCAALLKYITDGINVEIDGQTPIICENKYKIGSLILISTIPHIYQIRDAHELDLMKKEIQRKKVFGLWNVKVTR